MRMLVKTSGVVFAALLMITLSACGSSSAGAPQDTARPSATPPLASAGTPTPLVVPSDTPEPPPPTIGPTARAHALGAGQVFMDETGQLDSYSEDYLGYVRLTDNTVKSFWVVWSYSCQNSGIRSILIQASGGASEVKDVLAGDTHVNDSGKKFVSFATVDPNSETEVTIQDGYGDSDPNKQYQPNCKWHIQLSK